MGSKCRRVEERKKISNSHPGQLKIGPEKGHEATAYAPNPALCLFS